MYRMFNYRDEQRGALRAYNLKRAPLARLEAAIYPLAGRRCGGAAVLGVRGAFEQMAPVTSQVADRRLETGAFAYQAELLARIPVGVFIFRPSVGYFARRYSVAGNVVPNVLYRSVGGDLQIELRARALRLELGGGGRLVVDAGQIESAAWFPEATARTYTGRARVGWALSGWLEVVAGADAEYSSFRFNVPASAAAGAGYPNGVASGAYDFYVRGLLALRGHIPPGSGSGSSRRPPE
jgi:hypothetical protein